MIHLAFCLSCGEEHYCDCPFGVYHNLLPAQCIYRVVAVDG